MHKLQACLETRDQFLSDNSIKFLDIRWFRDLEEGCSSSATIAEQLCPFLPLSWDLITDPYFRTFSATK